MFFSNYNEKSRGVTVLFKNTFQYNIKEIIPDTEGRYIIINLFINNENTTIANVYGPNDDNPVFFQQFQSNIEKFENSQLIVGGDFNVVQNYLIDIPSTQNKNNPKAQEVIINLKEELDLIDPWRENNPETRMYTWHNSRHKQSRLDYFLISTLIMQNVQNVKIKPGYRSDHALVECLFKLDNLNKGHGLWKMNNSLLKDLEYETLIKQCINDTRNQYKEYNNEENDQMLQKYVISDKLLFEVIKTEIRGKTIEYATRKKREVTQQEKILDKDINLKYQIYTKAPTDNNLQQLNESQNALKLLREQKVDGLIIRAKAKWQIEGERNSKYFLHLENKHYQEKTLRKLIDEEGNHLTEINTILNEQKRFYEELYTSKLKKENETSRGIYNKFFSKENRDQNKLTQEQASQIEGDISVTECFNVLKEMKNNKSPGSDGFSKEFYMHFWEELKFIMVRSFKQSFNEGVLSDSQKLGVITCLPKPGKEREYIKNWRPVTLLNVDYKIISGVIANRIKIFLDSLISESQKGFIKGRQIGECTRLISDVIYHLKKHNKAGILLLIDFTKAFDSLEWSFLDKTLEHFCFGENIRKWVKLFYNKIQSCIINNGNCSERFDLGRGVRQGDPLSPYLFILATEILTNTIYNTQEIKGINIDDTEYILSQLADDITLLLEPDELSFKTCLNLLDDFSSISGLEINFLKTLAVKVGLPEELVFKLDRGKEIQWQTMGTFTLLGIKYNLDNEDITEGNYRDKLRELDKILNNWSGKKLTLYGRICIVKSLALPKMVHLFSSIPNPSEELMKKIEQTCFHFIWNGKTEKIKRSTLCKNYEQGGLKMINIRSFCFAQKIFWVKKLLDDENFSKWKLLFLSQIEKFGGNYIWTVNQLNNNIKRNLNPFWKDVLEAWKTLTTDTTDPREEPIFHNEKLRIGGNPFYDKEWHNAGIKYINDLIDQSGNLYSLQEWKNQYQIEHSDFMYISVIHAIPRNWKKRIKEIGTKMEEVKIRHIILIKNLKKPGKYLYMKHIETLENQPNTAELKWEKLLNHSIDHTDWKKFYNLPLIATKETYIKTLQFKILHRIVPTNKWLYMCRLTETPNCTFCNIHKETIEHLFWECYYTKNLWFRLKDWLLNMNIMINIGLKECLLGGTDQLFVEHVKLMTKEYIYKTKLHLKEPQIQDLKMSIKSKIIIEKHYLTKKEFQNKWHKLKDI